MNGFISVIRFHSHSMYQFVFKQKWIIIVSSCQYFHGRLFFIIIFLEIIIDFHIHFLFHRKTLVKRYHRNGFFNKNYRISFCEKRIKRKHLTICFFQHRISPLIRLFDFLPEFFDFRCCFLNYNRYQQDSDTHYHSPKS